MLLLGDVGQQLDIQETRTALAQIQDRLRATGQFDHEVSRRLDQLTAENAELKLYLAAIIRLLVAKGAIAPAELQEIVARIDRADGRADGKFSGPLPPA
jgi:hypothetical protein